MNEGQLMVFPAAATCMGAGQVRAPLVRGTISIVQYRARNDCAPPPRECLNPDYARRSWGHSTTDAGRGQTT